MISIEFDAKVQAEILLSTSSTSKLLYVIGRPELFLSHNQDTLNWNHPSSRPWYVVAPKIWAVFQGMAQAMAPKFSLVVLLLPPQFRVEVLMYKPHHQRHRVRLPSPDSRSWIQVTLIPHFPC